jgi:hypothetical protein
MSVRARQEIKRAIRFYERRGWCWFGIVEYLCRQYAK